MIGHQPITFDFVNDARVIVDKIITFIMLFVFFRFSGGQQKTGLEFLMADRGAGVVPVACSLMASFISAISLLGVTRQTLVITQTITFPN